MNKIIDNLIFASLSLVVAMLCAGWMILLAKLIVSGHFYWAMMLFFTTVFFISLFEEDKTMTKEELKTNKYGCRPSQDVCLVHDCPLVTYGICEDSPELTEFIKEIKDQAYQAGQEAERAKFVADTQKLADSVPPNLLLNEIVNKYWQPCEHDYSITLLSNPPQYQCKKCNQIKR